MITADQIVAHLVGDYILQSDWMSSLKTKRSLPAFVHALTYTLPFLVLSRSLAALAIILGTHFVIDRFRLARQLCWVKNLLAPKTWTVIKPDGETYTDGIRAWAACQATGYSPDKPAWLAVWLLIIADNTVHLLINGLALRYF